MLLTAMQAAEKMNISRTKFHTIVKPHLPYVTVGEQKYYLWEDIVEYLQGLKNPPSSQTIKTIKEEENNEG